MFILYLLKDFINDYLRSCGNYLIRQKGFLEGNNLCSLYSCQNYGIFNLIAVFQVHKTNGLNVDEVGAF